VSALPSLRQLKYLVALAEQLNFTRAARASFVTQSTLSAGLRELEDTLGARLVERDRKTVAMTPLGIEVAARARSLIAQAEDLAELAAGAAAPMTGTLRLGVIPTIAPFLLPIVLPELRSRYPKLKLALREDLTANLLARLEAAQLDQALIALPYDTGDMLQAPLFDDEFWLVGREDDPALKQKRAVVNAPVAERLLLLEEGHCLREHTLAACARTAKPNPTGIEATSLPTLIQMVESGLGLALLPEMALKSGMLAGTQLVARPLAPPVPKRNIALLARPTTARRAEFETVANLMREAHARGERRTRTSAGRRKAVR
jgi:LysR family hydrogen peroxide-inducible transcriptional activator